MHTDALIRDSIHLELCNIPPALISLVESIAAAAAASTLRSVRYDREALAADVWLHARRLLDVAAASPTPTVTLRRGVWDVVRAEVQQYLARGVTHGGHSRDCRRKRAAEARLRHQGLADVDIAAMRGETVSAVESRLRYSSLAQGEAVCNTNSEGESVRYLWDTVESPTDHTLEGVLDVRAAVQSCAAYLGDNPSRRRMRDARAKWSEAIVGVVSDADSVESVVATCGRKAR